MTPPTKIIKYQVALIENIAKCSQSINYRKCKNRLQYDVKNSLSQVRHYYLTLRKIAFWMWKNCQIFDVLIKKNAQNCHLKNKCQWHTSTYVKKYLKLVFSDFWKLFSFAEHFLSITAKKNFFFRYYLSSAGCLYVSMYVC